MGRDIVRFSIEGYVSRHNIPRDERDDSDWDFLVSKLKDVLADHEDICQSLGVQEQDW